MIETVNCDLVQTQKASPTLFKSTSKHIAKIPPAGSSHIVSAVALHLQEKRNPRTGTRRRVTWGKRTALAPLAVPF